jgi:chaperonin GroES
MRKDTLAAGGRKATFAGGFGEGMGPSVMSETDRAALNAQTAQITVEKKYQPRQKFYPVEGVLLVRRMEATKASEILVTDTMEQERPAEGFVVEARNPANLGVSHFDIGTHIVFGKYSGTEFKLNGEVFLLMNVNEILGTIEDEPELTDEEFLSGNWTSEGDDIVFTPGTVVAQA